MGQPNFVHKKTQRQQVKRLFMSKKVIFVVKLKYKHQVLSLMLVISDRDSSHKVRMQNNRLFPLQLTWPFVNIVFDRALLVQSGWHQVIANHDLFPKMTKAAFPLRRFSCNQFVLT